ncbi:hypothetical protein CCACVL1_15119, partial [Corchorus capsularis]
MTVHIQVERGDGTAGQATFDWKILL